MKTIDRLLLGFERMGALNRLMFVWTIVCLPTFMVMTVMHYSGFTHGELFNTVAIALAIVGFLSSVIFIIRISRATKAILLARSKQEQQAE